MSLSEKVNEFIHSCFTEGNHKFAAMTMEQRLKAAFYEGAEETLRLKRRGVFNSNLQAEIDRFKGLK